MLDKTKVHLRIGDETYANADSLDITLPVEREDKLLYDCWNLFKDYAAALDVTLSNKSGNDPDIDFAIVKEIQEHILDIFSNNRFTIHNTTPD